MATKINDLASTTRLWQAIGPVVASTPQVTSTAIDMLAGDGPCFAILSAESATVPSSLIVQASADGTTWADIPGATIPAGVASTRALVFARPQRYVRAIVNLDESGDDVPLSVLVGQMKKTF
jgi:hypothetical protein